MPVPEGRVAQPVKWTIVRMAEDWAGLYEDDWLKDEGHSWVDVEEVILKLGRYMKVPEIEFLEAWDWQTGITFVSGRRLPDDLAELRRLITEASANQFT